MAETVRGASMSEPMRRFMDGEISSREYARLIAEQTEDELEREIEKGMFGPVEILGEAAIGSSAEVIQIEE